MAGVLAIFFQPHLLQEVAGASVADASSLFKGLFMTFYGSTQIDTGNEALNSLVATRGMAGMMNTIWLIICAMCFGGSMTASGMLESLTSVFLRFMKRRVGMVASTVFSGLFLNIVTADQYISIILTGNMFKDIYKKKGYESRLLSRTDGRFRNRNVRAGTVEHLRHDASHDIRRSDPDVSSLLLL